MEDKISESGTPQGGVKSPLLANIHLRVVLDQWFARDVLPRLKGRAQLVRYAGKDAIGSFQTTSTPKPHTFDFLGFTHHWGVSKKNTWYVQRSAAQGRLTRALERIRMWCRIHRHDAVQEQQQALQKKLQGHYGYYGITGNARGIARYYWNVTKIWAKWLRRRSQRARTPWDRFSRMIARYPLPLPILPTSEPAFGKSRVR